MNGAKSIDISRLRERAEKKPISSISDFLAQVTEFVPRSGDHDRARDGTLGPASPCRLSIVWARGVPNTNYSLEPGLLREKHLFCHDGTDLADIAKLRELEDELMALFRTRAISLAFQASPPERETFDLLCTMQHHGAPTRLLDWSGNPLTALYFALDDYLEDSRRIKRFGATDVPERIPGVWLFRPRVYNHHIHDFEGVVTAWDRAWIDEVLQRQGSPKKQPVAVMPSYVNKRITAQQGRFTLHPFQFDGLENAFMDDAPGSDEWLRFLRVVPGSVHRIFSELRDIGIHEFSQFPDLEGLGKYSSKLWREALFNIEEKKERDSKKTEPKPASGGKTRR